MLRRKAPDVPGPKYVGFYRQTVENPKIGWLVENMLRNREKCS